MGAPVYLIWIVLSWGNIWRLDICTPILQKELTCKRELSNRHDKYAIKVVKEGETVGHTTVIFKDVYSYFAVWRLYESACDQIMIITLKTVDVDVSKKMKN